MASAGTGSGSLPPNFFLTPQQQSLLFTALNTNRQPTSSPKGALPLSENAFRSSPLNGADNGGFQESPFLDNYDYDFGDSSFDFSFTENGATMIGDLPAETAGSAKSDSTENDTPEKRSHPDDEDDDSSPGNDSKRREGGEKVPKKPGRKPLTSEPTSKRKAQNRAAQRAFRERKEKHLKDLETKVEELEKASEDANHENSVLRAQVERMTSELNHYKQKMTLMTSQATSRAKPPPFGNAAVSNINDVNFQFEFPRFGALPGTKTQRSLSQPLSPQSQLNQSTSPPASLNKPSNGGAQALTQKKLLESLYAPSMSTSAGTGSRASLDSINYSPNFNNSTGSPSASSHSNNGPNSSCGTSPEPYTQSPLGFKPVDTLTTIGEEQQSSNSSSNQPFGQFANLDFSSNNFDWLVQQNGGHFDPQLFGDYREPQENVLSNANFDDLFNDPVDTDFVTPYNMASTSSLSKMGVKKPNLIDQIDAQQNSLDEVPSKKAENMSCTQLWERLQSCPNAQSGDFDLDGLCQELTKKAKCSGSGPVVAEQDFDSILRKYMGKDASTDCVAQKMGITVDKSPRPASNPMP